MTALAALLLALAQEETPDLLTGDWGGARTRWEESGLSLELRAVYTLQGVVAGGIDGTPLEALSSEDELGNTGSLDFVVGLDTGKAGLWSGGSFSLRIDARAGRSALSRAGTISAVNLDALIPNVTDRFDEETLAITDFSYAHDLGGGFAVYGGLLNTWEGDANELAGSAMSASHFLNGALLYSAVEDATVPNVALGGGVEWSGEVFSGSVSLFATEESAGENPFRADGVTLSTEWTFSHQVGELGGAQTIGFLYGGAVERTELAQDPRQFLARLLLGLAVPTTSDATWALYYNAHQYLKGNAEAGWGLFVRFGVSDGDPNPVAWNLAFGASGRGTFAGRDADSWGAGLFVLGASDEDLLAGMGIDREVGAEAYYALEVVPGFRVTIDAQVIDSALDVVDTTWVLGLRTSFEF